MKHNEINNILYNTLKDILKLQSGCQKFVLEVDIHSFPVVTQWHLIGNDTETLTQETSVLRQSKSKLCHSNKVHRSQDFQTIPDNESKKSTIK